MSRINKKKYEDEIDGNFTDVYKHDILLDIYVSDLSKYQDEKSFKELKQRVFAMFQGNIDTTPIENGMKKFKHDEKICAHYADKKSIFDLPDILSLDQQGDFFTKMYDKDDKKEEFFEADIPHGSEVYHDHEGNEVHFDG